MDDPPPYARSPRGDILGVISLVRDITRHKSLGRKEKERGHRYRHLLEHLFDAAVIHREGRVIHANDAALKLFGAGGLDDIPGRPVLDFVHPDSLDDVRDRVLHMTNEPDLEVAPQKEKLVRLDGGVVDVEAVATGIYYEGKKAVLVLFRDISGKLHG